MKLDITVFKLNQFLVLWDFLFVGKIILCLIGVMYGSIMVISGLKKQKKRFLFSVNIKDPTFNIIYGIIMIIFFISVYISWYSIE
ncbi:MAG: hypothetical protein JWN83_218 [Chitinophagaceae bacterium]|nr:hypothetical protein [Chitinophagaceae bacterium]